MSDFATIAEFNSLKPRGSPYWHTLQYCRHIGVQKYSSSVAFWLARFRTKAGKYEQSRLSEVNLNKFQEGVEYQRALDLANRWFASDRAMKNAAEPYPIGVNQELACQPIGSTYTVGHALADYVAWKRIAATKSHFETNLSLINHHLVPRLAQIPLEAFNGQHMTRFAMDVLETPPKRGRQTLGKRRKLSELTPEELRKRKKTLNTLIGILRLAFRIAWENGKIDNERSWRCLRRVPNADRPRIAFLTRNECNALLNSCPPDLRNLVLGALYTGCRISELVALRVKDVARGGYGVYVWNSKNNKSRFVFLPDEGMAFFLSICEGRAGDASVFLNHNGNAWSGTYKHHFKEAVVKAGLPTELVFHGLRHTYASQLVQAGVPLPVVAKQLGHASADTVSRTYGHLQPQYAEAVVRSSFEPLSEKYGNLAANSRAELENLWGKLQGKAPTGMEAGSWPSSNFFVSESCITKAIRDAERL